MLANATRICDAKFGTLNVCEGDVFRIVAMHGVPPAVAKKLQRWAAALVSRSALGRLARTKQTVHIADALTERGLFGNAARFSSTAAAMLADARTLSPCRCSRRTS